jgi:hypothetical protein
MKIITTPMEPDSIARLNKVAPKFFLVPFLSFLGLLSVMLLHLLFSQVDREPVESCTMEVAFMVFSKKGSNTKSKRNLACIPTASSRST